MCSNLFAICYMFKPYNFKLHMYNDMDSYKRYCFSEQQASMISVSKGEGCIGQTVTILQRFLFYSSNYLMTVKLICNHI